MAGKKHSSLDRVLGRLDTLDSVNLANLVQRLARERGVFEEIFNTLQEGVLVIRDDGTIEYAYEQGFSVASQTRRGLAAAVFDIAQGLPHDFLIEFSPDGNCKVEQVAELVGARLGRVQA